jgi:hypothetical protein
VRRYACLSPDDMESLVRYVEDVFIAAALDPVATG